MTGLPLREASQAREDLIWIKREIFARINRDREAQGVAPVGYDRRAAQVGESHCVEMLERAYLSHWNQSGYKPYHRWALAGGTDAVSENVSCLDANYDVHPTLDAVIAHALESHQAMMAERPPEDGHRRTILDPRHTHVGIGIAFDRRRLRMAQEFVGRHVAFTEAPPATALLQQTVPIRGRILRPQQHRLHSLAVFYEPFPAPMTVAELRATGSYGFPDDVDYEHPRLEPGWGYADGGTGSLLVLPDGQFECPVRFRRGLPGLYTLCVWLQDRHGGAFPATSATISVHSAR